MLKRSLESWLIVLLAVLPAAAQNTCDGKKLKCMRTKASCLLDVHQRAIGTGTAPDAAKLARCQLKFDDPLTGCIAKVEAQQNATKPGTVCTIPVKTEFLEAAVDACVADALAGLGNPAGPNSCDSGKLKCMRRKNACLLAVHKKSVTTGLPLDAARLALCQLEFDDPVTGCIARVEAKQSAAKPTTVCSAVGDTAVLEGIVDACVTDLVGAIATCPEDGASLNGLTARGAQFLHQNFPGVEDVAEPDDGFASFSLLGGGLQGLFDGALMTGDFDGDGFDDLLVNVPGEHATALSPATGALALLYGSPLGLFGTSRDLLLPPEPPQFGGSCGGALPAAVGDFNGDGRDDVVLRYSLCSGISCPPSDCVPVVSHGYGSPSGLVGDGTAHYLNMLASVAGDFNGDSHDDLIATVDWEEVIPSIGFRRLLVPGGPDGLSDLSDEFNPDISRVFDDDFGSVTKMVKGDFDDDPIDDVVEAYPGPLLSAGGGVRFRMNGGTSGSTWTQDSPGIVGGSEAGDRFGWSLAVGDFDGDGLDDLAIGVPGEDATFPDQGAFQRVFGDGSGLTDTGNQLFGASTIQAGARYGTSVVAGNFDNADAADEVAAGAPLHDVAGFSDAGYVDIRFGNATTTQWWQGNATGIPGATESGDYFGEALAVGDFNGDGADDLVIAVPRESIGNASKAGAVNILYGTPLCQP